MKALRERLTSCLLIAAALSLPARAASAGEATLQKSSAAAVLDLWIEQQLEYRGLPGLAIAVVHDQEVLWKQAYGWADVERHRPMTTTTPFRIGSVTKLFTATAIMQLRDRGSLQLDSPVAAYLPWVELDSGSGPYTVKQLLTHTAGLPREAPLPYWTTHHFPDRQELIDALDGLTPGEPATDYQYSNLGMGLLGEVVAAVSGESYSGFVARQLFEPLAMVDSTAAPTAETISRLAVGYMRRRLDRSRGVFDYYDTGVLAPAANIVSTLEDLTRFATLQFRDDDPTAEPVVRGSTLREMHRVHWLRPGWTSGRGLGFGVSNRNGTTIVSHGGWIAGNRVHLLLVPSEKIAVIAMVNADDGQPHVFGYEAYDTFAATLEAGEDGDRELGDATCDRSDWSRYFGLYADPWEWEYRVLELDGELVLYDYSYPPANGARDGVTVLEPVGEHEFRMPDGDPVIFEFDDRGEVVRVQRRHDYIFPVATAPRSKSGGS